MQTASFVLAALAALIHVAIFAMESLLWKRPAVRRLFGAPTDHPTPVLDTVMFNQGFYNLFLAVGTVVGLVMAGISGVGWIAVFCLATMVLAACVLWLRSPRMWRGALIQGAMPLLALVTALQTQSAA